MTRVTFSHPGPAGRSQRVHISSLKTMTPFHWPLDVKAGRRFGLAASSLALLPRAREGQRRPTTPQWGPCSSPPCLSQIEPGLRYLLALALSVASARSGPPGRIAARTCTCRPRHRYLYLLTAASAAARPCDARQGSPRPALAHVLSAACSWACQITLQARPLAGCC